MLTHKECNPGRLEKNQQQEGLLLHEWKVQMGLSQGDLLTLQESIQAVQSAHSRRVLSGLQLQPQIRHSIAQWPCATKTEADTTKGASFDLWRQSDLSPDGDLGGRRLSVLGAAQSSVRNSTACQPNAVDI